ncbi:hypothetical protein CRG98_034988 [Punica granatum]|uniref:DC1 domain-containing protein n=1 Tax=Punica granatum TaxID=22663 RepID=A0A2I0ILL0_PUNGR|nr:hypothetical protein CRG98_034988 [Punica granatum]
MEDLILKQLDEQISREEAEIEALKKKLERSMKNLEEFKKKRREISKLSGARGSRIGQFLRASSPAYHCIEYCEFFLHKSCAELPPEIQHPSHPQHPLAIISSREYSSCSGCENPISHEYSYKCRLCFGVDLHMGCAAATLPPPEAEHKDEQEHEEEIIQHFAHEHPLASFHVNATNWICCEACNWQISGRVYGCRACIFVLHESCALAPREIMNHPFHPQHPLTLLFDGKNSRSTDDRRDQIHHFSHPHQLTFLHAKAKLLATCDVCEEGISGDFYCCPDCLFLLHPLCAKLRQEIVHPLHPDHPLICRPSHLKCSLCSNDIKHDGFGFECEECPFGLDVGCALLTLSATKEELTLNSELLHKHPMRIQFLTEEHDCESGGIVCCECPAEGLVYVCTDDDCDMMIHKTCAELPRESEHPVHPQHPLLLSNEPPDKSNPCFACLESSRRFTYCCDYCKIQFHAHCAMRRPTLKHPRHEHSLSYFDKIGRELYRAQCNLVLRDRVVDEHYDYEEQFCDVCETLRNPELGVYYCEDCNYAADIDCVIPKANLEKRRQMEDTMLKQLDEQIASKEAGAETLKIKMEMAQKEWDLMHPNGQNTFYSLCASVSIDLILRLSF